MSRFLVVSSDCHAGLPPERYRDYLDPEYREDFDRALAIEIAQREEMAKLFLVDEFNERWKAENRDGLTGRGIMTPGSRCSIAMAWPSR